MDKFRASLLAVMVFVLSPQTGFAQGNQAPARTARSSAQLDLTGYWVSIVDEDWRYRMLAPQGDYAGVPLNDEGKKTADQWTRSLDGSCDAYGAANLMRMPTRLLISWESDNVLKIETDAGVQTRRFFFDKKKLPVGQRSLQGHSLAEWQDGGVMRVVTTNLRAGWLRRNGVPYGENAMVNEYYDRFTSPDSSEWFVVTTIVEDSTYLTQPFVTSTQFRKESNGAKWRAETCKTR